MQRKVLGQDYNFCFIHYKVNCQKRLKNVFKNYREHHTRENSRLNTNKDLLHILLISSDSVISSHRKIKTKNKSKLSNEARMLLKINDLNSIKNVCFIFKLTSVYR